jgi:hypothetical protein
VSRAAAVLDEQLSAWRDRPIGEITYLILDARSEKVRHGGAIVPCALLTAIGIGPNGKRSILRPSSQRSVTIGKPNVPTSPWKPDDPPLKTRIYRRGGSLSCH